MAHGERFVRLVDAGRARVTECDVRAVRARQQAGDRFWLLDVREREEWVAGHLPGATHLSKGVIERDIEALVPDLDAELVLYCGGGYRSVLAAESLQRMGYRRVTSMDGGWKGWCAEGYPLVVP